MAPDRVFEPIVAESSSGSSTAGASSGATPNAESPNHPGHPDLINENHDPYNVNQQFEPLHGPLGGGAPLEHARTHTSQYGGDARHFEPIHTHTSHRQDVEVRAGDRAELQRIASAGTLTRAITQRSRASRGNLQRVDTYADVTLDDQDDPRLDPNSPQFVSNCWRWSARSP